jgi:hypothetical protein
VLRLPLAATPIMCSSHQDTFRILTTQTSDSSASPSSDGSQPMHRIRMRERASRILTLWSWVHPDPLRSRSLQRHRQSQPILPCAFDGPGYVM